MKIVYCIAGMYNSGGMERVLANKANYWVHRGHDVVIVTTDQRGRKPFFALDERIDCCDLEVNYEENNGKSFWNKLLHYFFKQMKHKIRLTALLKRLKADVVVSMFCNEVSFVADIHDGSMKVLEAHFSMLKRLQYGRKGLWRLADVWRTRTDKKVVKKFHRFVVLTHQDEKYWGDLPNRVVIPNAIAVVSEKQATLDAKKAIAVGRYTHQKGFDLLIKAWQYIYLKHPEWELSIYGGGDKTLYMELRDELGLEDVIHLEDATDEIMSKYGENSIFILSSRYEGFGLVILEAMACGLPVVSFSCPCGPKDLIENEKTGFLIENYDLVKLSEKLILLMEDEELRKQMGKAARENAFCFTEETVMRTWTELFEQLIIESRWKQL